MIHTVKIDESTMNGKKLMREVRRYKKGVTIENSFVIPEGYVTGEEFSRRVIERLEKTYREHGLL